MEHSIPPGNVESIVAAGLIAMDGMVNSMHIGGDQEKPQELIDVLGKFEIAMIKNGARIENDLEENNTFWACT